MPLFLLAALGWAKKALTAILDLARRYPREMAIVALLCLAAWLWQGWNKANAYSAALISASDKASAAFRAQIKAQQDSYNILAKETDREHKKALADAGDRTDRFIAANRVRPQACRPDRATQASQDQAAAAPQVSAPDAVLVDASDVRACSAAAVYAQSSYEWAQGLVAKGLAE